MRRPASANTRSSRSPTRADPVPAAASASDVVLLLPAWSAFGQPDWLPGIAGAIGRADVLERAEPGIHAQLLRHFRVRPARWSAAAVIRQSDAGDAAGAAWLRADPAHVRADINGARLLGVGERLGVSQADAEALLPALKPVFGDAGMALDAPSPSRWYLRLPREATLPAFSDPDRALGEDLFEHQPQGEHARRWRALSNEAQVILHNHPHNAFRRECGLVPINALWFWGGGVLFDQVSAPLRQVSSDDRDLCALCALAGIRATCLPPAFDPDSAHGAKVRHEAVELFDLRGLRDPAQLQQAWLSPALRAVRTRAIASLAIDSTDGGRFELRAAQRWRIWRRPWTGAC